jgi:CRP/FNR family transcriptional regulator, cyclic AMP receptor protein
MSLHSPASSPHHVTPDFLASIPLFNGLEQGTLEEIADLMIYRAFGKGMTIFHQDMPGTTLYLIADGYVRTYSIGQTGQEFTYWIYGPGEVFGELSLLDQGYHSATCTTMTPIKTWLLSKENLFSILRRHPPLMLRLLGLIAHRVRIATRKAEVMAFQDVQGRLAYEMLSLADKGTIRPEQDITIEVPLTQNELASMVGATRESVNKVLSLLKSQNMIRLSGTSIVICDVQGLQRMVVERGR